MQEKENLHYVVLVDVGIGNKDTSNFGLKKGMEYDIFLRSPNYGYRYTARVWPGDSFLPDWFHPNV